MILLHVYKTLGFVKTLYMKNGVPKADNNIYTYN
jgi:hypothetical protein